MKPSNWPFYISDANQLLAEAERLNITLPFSTDTSQLQEDFLMRGKRIPNRWCALPISGNDALPDGSPSQYTKRRYTRYASGGFGTIWVEGSSDSSIARSKHDNCLILHKTNLPAFADLVRAIRNAAGKSGQTAPVVILQMSCACPKSVFSDRENAGDDTATRNLSDSDLCTAHEELIATARLAALAGFDGIDIRCCPGTLPFMLLTAFERPGRYGGTFENRTRFLRDAVSDIRKNHAQLIVAVRINAYTASAHPKGFGVNRKDYREYDMSEPARLAALLQSNGADLISITANSPNLRGAAGRRELEPFSSFNAGDEHPLITLARHLNIAHELRSATTGMPVVAGGFAWTREFLPQVAAGTLENNIADFIGLGRPALAYPDIPNDVMKTGASIPGKCCSLCQACLETARTGCVLKDPHLYGPEYRHARRFSFDRLFSEAQKCSNCPDPQCLVNIPGNLDIPGFVMAFLENRMHDAFTIIRASNLLPETSAALSYASPQHIGEANCIHSILSERPVPVRDIMITASQVAREQGITGVRVPPGAPSERRIAVVGGGPAGISAAARLVEHGHSVTLFERMDRLGGVPEILISSSRFTGATDEIQSLLRPAVKAGRLDIKLGAEWGRGRFTLDRTREAFDAVLLAAGLWKNHSMGKADGLADAVHFLQHAKEGRWTRPIVSAAILGGGDCAMDSSLVALELGAKRLYVVFPGQRADMLWCMDESFFSRPGVHALMLTRPLGYEISETGSVKGLRVCPMLPDSGGSYKSVLQGEYVIEADTVIEASGLRPTETLISALHGLAFDDNKLLCTRSKTSYQTGLDRVYTAGSLMNGGASVPQCAAEGMCAAEEIHLDLSLSVKPSEEKRTGWTG